MNGKTQPCFIAGPAIVLHRKGIPDCTPVLFRIGSGTVPTFTSRTVGVDVGLVLLVTSRGQLPVRLHDGPAPGEFFTGNIVVPIDCTLASDLLVELVVFCCPTTLEGVDNVDIVDRGLVPVLVVVLAPLPCPTAVRDVSDKVVLVGCTLASDLVVELVVFCCPTTLEGVDNVDIVE